MRSAPIATLACVGLCALASGCVATVPPPMEVVATTGYAQERFKEPEPYDGPPRSGAEVYRYRCESCHARSTQGAPLPDDTYEWSRRFARGMDVLVKHTIDGSQDGLMPERGGCRNCSDAEIEAGILYMLRRSGVLQRP